MNPQKNQIIIKNKVKDYCESRGLDRLGFIGVCLQSTKTFEGRRLKADTAGRVYDGKTIPSLSTAGLVAAALGVRIEDLFELQ